MRRLCLRLVMMQYDPLGIATPVIVRLKAAMRYKFSPDYGLEHRAPS